MLYARNGVAPRVDPEARVAASAQIAGDVRIGARAYVDHGVVISSSGPPVEIGAEAVVLAGAVIRSVGGSSRPGFGVFIGERSLVAPGCALSGCRVGRACYLATGVIALQGAVIGDYVRVGAGAIVHSKTVLPNRARVGMRHVAAPAGDGYVSTADVELAREAVAAAGFFDTAFGTGETDQARLHEEVMSRLLDEVHGWRDEPVSG